MGRPTLPCHSLRKTYHVLHARRAADQQPGSGTLPRLAASDHYTEGDQQQQSMQASKGWLAAFYMVLLHGWATAITYLGDLCRWNKGIPEAAAASIGTDLQQPWRGHCVPVHMRLQRTLKQCRQWQEMYQRRRQQHWEAWLAAGHPVLHSEDGYGAYRNGQPRSHSSSSDASAGRWLMRGWDPNHSPTPPRDRSRSRRRPRPKPSSKPQPKPNAEQPTRTRATASQARPEQEREEETRRMEADTEDESPSSSHSRASMASRHHPHAVSSPSPSQEYDVEYSPPSQNTYEAERSRTIGADRLVHQGCRPQPHVAALLAA